MGIAGTVDTIGQGNFELLTGVRMAGRCKTVSANHTEATKRIIILRAARVAQYFLEFEMIVTGPRLEDFRTGNHVCVPRVTTSSRKATALKADAGTVSSIPMR
jgi:hypothetical protein